MTAPTPDEAAALTQAQRRAVRDELDAAEVRRNRRLAERIASGRDVMRGRIDEVLTCARQMGAANLDIAGPRVLQIVDEVERLRAEVERARDREQAVRDLCDRADRETFETSMFPGFVDTDDIRAALGPVETPQEDNR